MESQLESYSLKIAFAKSTPVEGYISRFGFSVLIHNLISENFILFDTGSDGKALLHNLDQFGVDPSEIKKVVISHNHLEHSGGLDDLYKNNSNLEIYVPNEIQNTFRRKYLKSDVIGVSKLEEIDRNVYLTGQLGTYLKEQALFLETQNAELVVIVGCAHPGLDDILSLARGLANIKAIIGGFHNFRHISLLEGIDFIGACHCTHNTDLIRNQFLEEFHEIRVGESLPF